MWLKPNALWAYKHARWKPCCCGIFCSRFHLILSPLKIILEMVFWTNLMLDLICTWLEKTRRFCRQVNKKISSCFWTASTCVQRSSLGWCSRLTYMETVDWIHVIQKFAMSNLEFKLSFNILISKVSFIILRHCRTHRPCSLCTWGGASSLTKTLISQSALCAFASAFTLVTLALCLKCRRTLKGTLLSSSF